MRSFQNIISKLTICFFDFKHKCFKASDSTFLYGVYNDYKDYTHPEQQTMENT